jgi:hypothetical protein
MSFSMLYSASSFATSSSLPIKLSIKLVHVHTKFLTYLVFLRKLLKTAHSIEILMVQLLLEILQNFVQRGAIAKLNVKLTSVLSARMIGETTFWWESWGYRRCYGRIGAPCRGNFLKRQEWRKLEPPSHVQDVAWNFQRTSIYFAMSDRKQRFESTMDFCGIDWLLIIVHSCSQFHLSVC